MDYPSRVKRMKTVLGVCSVLNIYFDNLLNEEDEDGNVAEIFAMAMQRNERISISGYSERIVYLYSEKEFQSHFRLERSNFDFISGYINNKIDRRGPGNPQVSIEKQLQITLWLLGNQEVYRSVADRFGVSMSTAWTSANRICKILSENCSDFIKWPSQTECRSVVANWHKISGFPGIIGAIDGSYIPISKPTANSESYFCRKKIYAITLQGVCSYDLRFIDVDIGSPSSMHDSRVYKCSDLKASIDLKFTEMFPNDYHMIGDSAYSNMMHLMVPFRKNKILSRSEIKYNKKLSKSRVLIEHTYGLLKGRFRRLKYMYMHRTDLIPLYVLGACILHNICLLKKDVTDIELDIEEEPNVSGDENIEADNTLANEKRNNIMNML